MLTKQPSHLTQLKDYGGWPEDQAEIPLKHMTSDHIKLLAAKCSRSKDIEMPVFPASPSKQGPENETSGRTAITPMPGPATSTNQVSNNLRTITPMPTTPEAGLCEDVSEKGMDGNEIEVAGPDGVDGNDEPEETWDMIKIMSINDLTSDSAIKCSTETCTLPAACAYVSNLAPKDKWYSCLDCQVS